MLSEQPKSASNATVFRIMAVMLWDGVCNIAIAVAGTLLLCWIIGWLAAPILWIIFIDCLFGATCSQPEWWFGGASLLFYAVPSVFMWVVSARDRARRGVSANAAEPA
jgi:hypothetical protein